jgi:4-amino-4-deoxychorismate lyase
MAWHFALMIDPADSGDTRSDFAGTFTEVDPAAPALTVGELSTQRGDGIFESIGVVDGHAQEVEAHLSRLGHSARLCDLPHPHLEQWRQAVALAAAACGAGEAVIKLILSRGIEHGPTPTAWVTAAPAADFSPRARGIRVVTLDRGTRSTCPRARRGCCSGQDAVVRREHGGPARGAPSRRRRRDLHHDRRLRARGARPPR